MEEDPCVPSDRLGGERKHRGEREGREEEGEKAYTIALGGYWIRNRGHTGYRRILLPTLTSLSHPLPLFVPKLRTIFSDGRRRGGAKSRLNALFARRSKGLPGVSFLPRPSHLRCPFARGRSRGWPNTKKNESIYPFYVRARICSHREFLPREQGSNGEAKWMGEEE